MKTEFYIACRLSSRKEGARAGVMERVATIATMVSLMVIIVTLAVVIGFKKEINRFLSSAIADIVVNHRAGSTCWADFKNPDWGVVMGSNYKVICSDDEGFGDKDGKGDSRYSIRWI